MKMLGLVCVSLMAGTFSFFLFDVIYHATTGHFMPDQKVLSCIVILSVVLFLVLLGVVVVVENAITDLEKRLSRPSGAEERK